MAIAMIVNIVVAFHDFLLGFIMKLFNNYKFNRILINSIYSLTIIASLNVLVIIPPY